MMSGQDLAEVPNSSPGVADEDAGEGIGDEPGSRPTGELREDARRGRRR